MKEYVPPARSIPTLEVPDLSGLRTVHLIGIGGAGMSGIAGLLLARGVRVSGSDLKDSKSLTRLRAAGAEVVVGHRAENVGPMDAVIVSTAIPPGNPERTEAERRGIPVFARAQVMAALMRERRGVAVSGTHGKTTTTSMVAVILERAGLDPTYLVGGDLNESGSNARSGRGDVFVAEADESDGSFLLLSPDVALVTNVEPDHLDFFADAEEVESAFVSFCRRAGTLVACVDDPGLRRVLDEVGAPAVGYGQDPSAAVRMTYTEPVAGGGRARIEVGGTTIEIELAIPGRHQLLNAAGAIAAAREVGVDPEVAAVALRGFTGVQRRFERRGSARGAEFVDDYAHHPTEIAATLAAARGDGGRRLVAVFQPHRYSRTRAMWRSLGESLSPADVVVLTDVYAAGEIPEPGITGKLVVDALQEASPRTRTVYLPHRSELARFLAREVREGDLVLTLGAGDITFVGDETLALLGDARDG
jgi:UDP-N-acetylmuramate--alanine ligase